MKVVVILFFFGLVKSQKVDVRVFADEIDMPKSHKIACDGVIFNHVYYDRKLFKGHLGRPYNLVFHKFSGILFFSHTISHEDEIDFGIMACHLERLDCMDIKGIDGGYAIGYDVGNDDMYMGGHDGIFKYNFLNRKAERFAEKGKSIWGLFIRRNFYYIEYPTQKLFVYKPDKFVEVAEARNIEIDHFFIARFGDIYFANKTALYKVARPVRDAVVLDDNIVIRQIAEDSYGDVYFCASDGIYVEEKPYHRVKMLAQIDNAFGLAFDQNDHVIYSDRDSIYRLVPSEHSKLCYKAIKAHADLEKENAAISKRVFGFRLAENSNLK